jgi:hypothetical protein
MLAALLRLLNVIFVLPRTSDPLKSWLARTSSATSANWPVCLPSSAYFRGLHPTFFAGFPEDSSIDALRGRSPSPSAAGSRSSAGAGAGAGSGSGSGSGGGSGSSGAGSGKEAKSDAAAEPGKKKEKPHWVAELGEDVMCCICQELMVL